MSVGGRRIHLTDDIIQQAFLSAANKLLATKDTVIADGREMMALLFDTTALEREQEELQQETQVVSDMVQQCIYENAHVALDQTEYQKRYDGLTERFEKARPDWTRSQRKSIRCRPSGPALRIS